MAIIRRASQQDFPSLLELERQAHSHPWAESVLQKMLNSSLPDSDTSSIQCWIMEAADNKALIGFYFVQCAAGEMTLLDMVIATASQGQGLGRDFLNHLIEQADNSDIDSIFLEVRVSNFPAIALYFSCGFAEVGQRDDYYPTNAGGRENALIMALPLRLSL